MSKAGDNVDVDTSEISLKIPVLSDGVLEWHSKLRYFDFNYFYWVILVGLMINATMQANKKKYFLLIVKQ